LKTKTAIVFLSGSAGELDWILPILDYLLKKEFDLKILFLTKHVSDSVEANSMLNNYINQENSKIELIFLGSNLWEKLEQISYLLHRFFIKFNLKNKHIIGQICSLFEKVLETLYMSRLSLSIGNLKNNKNVIFSEYPSLRRPRDKWVMKQFNESIFFYCPHSPHIYTEDLERDYRQNEILDLDKRRFLLMGHPGDYFVVNDKRELASLSLEKVFIGHPKYSKQWLNNRKNESEAFRSSFVKRKKANILVVSRGHGSYINEDAQKYYIEATCQVIHEQVKNYNLFVKKHPREKHSYWDKILEYYPSIKIVEDHVLDIATKVDFAITFWSSAAMECANLGVPVVEFYDPNKHSKQQIFEGDSFTTIYRKLGLVYAANDKKKLIEVVAGLLKKDHSMQLDRAHHFYNDLMNRSNLWEEKIEEILFKNDLIKS